MRKLLRERYLYSCNGGRRLLKQIKTVWTRIERSAAFDAEVNQALEDGWNMTLRTMFMPNDTDTYPLLYAEFEKDIGERCIEDDDGTHI